MVDGPFCSGCCQESRGEALVTFDGSASSGLMLIGESPWTDEIRDRRPFAGAAGYMLDRLLRRVSLDRTLVTVTNSAWCKARWLGWYDNPKRWPDSAEAMAHCAPHLDELIERMRPRVLVPMGNVALRRICGVSGIDEMTSYVFPTPYGIPAVPCYHPSFILRGKQKMSASVLFALNRAKEIASRGYSPTPPALLLDPDPVTLARYISEHTGSLWDGSVFIDLETPESSKLDEEEVEEMGASWIILRASFSLADNTGVSFPWTEPFIGIFRDLLSRSTETWEWATNHFDTRRLEAAGLALPARRISGLWAWHWLQSDLPKGLGKVAPYFGSTTAWKHMNTSEPAYYSAMDASEGRRAAYGSRDLLKPLGRWDSFERHCIDSDPILVRMGRTGVLIDIAERDAFMRVIQSEYDAAYTELQTVIPESVRPIKTWKRPPKDMTGVIDLAPPPPLLASATSAGVGGDVNNEVVSRSPTLKLGAAGLSERLNAVLPAESVPKWLYAAGVRYMRREEFNPESPDQVAALAKALKVKLPKKRDAEEGDEDAVTTEQKYLQAPARKHRAFRLILDCRVRSKLLTTYAWPLASDGRVKTVFGWHPSTLRKSSRSCNLQNIPKRSSLAKAFRRMIVAAPGHVLVEADWSAIEAVLVGWFARSERYMTLAKAGVHGWLTSALHGEIIDWRHPELFALAKEAKARWPDDYEKCKRVVHMSNYLGSPIRMAEEYPDDFPTVAVARKLQNFYFETDPGLDVRRWQRETVARADHDGYLDNPYGYRHWFYEVTYHDKRSGTRKPGDDAKRAVAFLPQSTASAIQSECLLRLGEIEEWLRLIIHDSFLTEPTLELRDTVCQILLTEMTRPIPELGCLVIGTELSWGLNWAPHSLKSNPDGMCTWTPT